RPLLAVLWLQQGRGVVPTQFITMVEGLIEEADLRDAVEQLLERKRSGLEMGTGPRIPTLHDYIDRHMDLLEDAARALPAPRGRTSDLNDLFRNMVEQAWDE
ncbi:MAG: nucleotidyltransferase domain-containing protein, partial [Phycisphaeraceae bacterium]|nr:nucleotidyltransferase domain-containing protein [Phycisphaeraceae bacterium]